MVKKFMQKHGIMLLIIIIILCLSIGYSAYNRELMISGEATVRIPADIRVTNIKLLEKVNSNELYNPKYSKDTTSTHVSLMNSNSSITYQVEITNTTGKRWIIRSIDELSFNNSQVFYEISGLEINKVYEEEKLLFTITFNSLSSNVEEVSLSLKYDLEIYDGYQITLINDEETLIEYTENNILTLENTPYLNNIDNYVAIEANNGVIPSINVNTLYLDNISKDTTVYLASSFSSSLNWADNSLVNIVILKDNEENKLTTLNNTNIKLNLNGKNITSSRNLNESEYLITNSGDLEIIGNNGSIRGNVSSILHQQGDLKIEGGSYNKILAHDKATITGSNRYCTNDILNCYPLMIEDNKEGAIIDRIISSSNGKGLGIISSGYTSVSNSQITCYQDNCFYVRNSKGELNKSTISAYGYGIRNRNSNFTINDSSVSNINIQTTNSSSLIRNEENGILTIKDGIYEINNTGGISRATVTNTLGTLNIYNGTFIGSTASTIENAQGIINFYNGTVTSLDNHAFFSTNGTTNIYTGKINAFLSTIVINSGGKGIFNILGGELNVTSSNGSSNIENRGLGTINICNATINGYEGKPELLNRSTGYIKYKSNVQFKYHNIASNPNIISDDSITCEG